jgi:hypothetical protein
MPCRSDYMDPNKRERDIVETCQHLIYVNKKLDLPTPEYIRVAAKSVYGGEAELEVVVPQLCGLLSSLTKEQENEIVYDGKIREARRLADWWDSHKEADRIRIEKEKMAEIEAGREKAQEEFKQSIKSKLDPAEIGYLKSLGVKFN